MGVAAGPGMHVDVDECGWLVAGDHRQAGLFSCLALRCFPWLLAGIDVTARLQPDRQTFVEMQHHAGITGDDGRGRDVGRRRLLVEWPVQRVERGEERANRIALACIDGLPGSNGAANSVSLPLVEMLKSVLQVGHPLPITPV